MFLAHLPTASAQSQADSATVLFEVAQEQLRSLSGDETVFLDPRPELRKTALALRVFQKFEDAGFRYYDSPGVPGPNVGLLSPGRIWESPRSTEVSVVIVKFGSRTGFLNTYSYHHLFKANCGEGGCTLGEKIGSMHGDGHTAARCWDDFFARSEEGRKECRARRSCRSRPRFRYNQRLLQSVHASGHPL